MHFTIAKPTDRMSFGDLFFPCPENGENRKAFEQLSCLCRERAKKVFAQHRKLSEQVERELNMIEKTDRAVTILILKEIADLSREMGYPTVVFGAEGGLLILYLLGVSGIHPGQYDYDLAPSQMSVAQALGDKGLSYTLAIAEPVREKIQHRLDRRFGKIRSSGDLYQKISVPDSELLERIGEYAKETGLDYRGIDVEERALLKAVCDDVCRKHLKAERNFVYPETSLDLAKVYAYAVCTRGSKERFESVKAYVFRDDVFRELNERIPFADHVVDLARNWSRGEKKTKVIEMMRRYDVPQEVLDVYRELENQWPAASCIARVNSLLMMKFYENCSISAPKIYVLKP